MKKLYLFLLATMMMVAGNVMAQKDAEHPWAGTYTLMLIDDQPYHYLPEEADAWNVATPDTFEVVIEWNANLNQYRVTKFYDLTTDALTNGSFELKVIDEKNAQIILTKEGFHVYGVQPAETIVDEGGESKDYPETKVLAYLTDGSNSTWSYEPVPVTMNSDGQISIEAFKVLYKDRSSMGWVVWTDGAVPLNGGDEPVVVEPRDWTGWYWMTVPQGYSWALDGNNYPQEGALEISKDENGNFIVTKFLGYDTATANASFSGGIYITPDKKKANKATIDCDQYMNLLKADDEMGMSGLVLCDAASENGPIVIEWDEETQTIAIDMFYFVHWNALSGEAPTDACGFYGVTALKGDPNAVTAVKNQETSDEAIYDITGRPATKLLKNRLYLKKGQKFLNR